MRITKFVIKNFKGISSTEILLNDEVPGNIVTLIGLNESGKTTILEAISHFISEDDETASLVDTVHRRSAIQDLVPKDKKAAFTGTISILGKFELDDADIESLAQHCRDTHGLLLDKDSVARNFTAERAYRFQDSSYVERKNFWSPTFKMKTKKATKFKEYNSSDNSTRAIWQDLILHLSRALPVIVYFPTFLFNFPDRIYLEDKSEEKADEIDVYYRQLVQGILDAQGDNLSVQRHIVDRIAKLRSRSPNPLAFLSTLVGLDEKTQIDAVIQRISNEMSKVIFGAWGEILGKKVTNKRVHVDWSIDAESENRPFLLVSIIDGQSRYALSERSLGFRWFFAFLLFTQFRKNEEGGKKRSIFLFDEPAANLHSKAQMKLLESFPKVASSETYIIYSTHSHYMVNPNWLEKAYIVENSAIDYEDEEEVESFDVRKTNIKATKYRAFVTKKPGKTTYFQPVLDALQVPVSPLERGAKAILIEGKFDYYPIRYLSKMSGIDDGPLIFPGTGSGTLGTTINLMRGWGVDFRILLDGDKGGKDGRKSYRDDYLVSERELVLLSDLDPVFSSKPFEAIYCDDVKAAVEAWLGKSTIGKRHYALYFQHLLVTGEKPSLPETLKAFSPIATWLRNSFP